MSYAGGLFTQTQKSDLVSQSCCCCKKERKRERERESSFVPSYFTKSHERQAGWSYRIRSWSVQRKKKSETTKDFLVRFVTKNSSLRSGSFSSLFFCFPLLRRRIPAQTSLATVQMLMLLLSFHIFIYLLSDTVTEITRQGWFLARAAIADPPRDRPCTPENGCNYRTIEDLVVRSSFSSSPSLPI